MTNYVRTQGFAHAWNWSLNTPMLLLCMNWGLNLLSRWNMSTLCKEDNANKPNGHQLSFHISNKPCKYKLIWDYIYIYIYLQDLLVLRDQEMDIIRKRELPWARRERNQVVIVNKVIATKSNQNQSLIHYLLCSCLPNHRTQPFLVLFEVLQLFCYPYNVYL